MTEHRTGTREEWLAARPELPQAEKEHTRRVVHLANHDVAMWAVSRAPLEKLQAYKRRMGWTFPWASSYGTDFNFDFNVSLTEEQQREGGIEYNYRREGAAREPLAGETVRKWRSRGGQGPVAEIAATTGTDVAT